MNNIRIILLVCLFALSPISSACVALVYHHFDTTTPASTSIAPTLFEKHLTYLSNNNFSVLSVSELLALLDSTESLPDKCVILTTDDAYVSIYTNAYPLLKKYNMPMSVFVATDVIDKKYSAYMSYDQMRNMKDIITFYNHSKDHSYLHALQTPAIMANINHAQQRLENELGTAQKILAYPYGEYSIEVMQTIKDMGYTAFGQHSGVINKKSNIYALPRFPMTNVYGSMKSFQTKVHTLRMPVIDATKQQITNTNPPTLKLTLEQELSLNCFANGEPIQNIKKENLTYFITANTPLPLGRNKYNCTAGSKEKNRFYWYSHQWLIK